MNPSLSINSRQAGQITFDTVFNSLEHTKGKYDDKSLRLHTNPGAGTNGTDQLTLKVHTSMSRLGHGAERATKRQGAYDLVHQSLKNQFGGSDEVAASILKRAGVTSDSRLTMGELRAIKDAVNNETMLQGELGALVGHLCSENPDPKAIQTALEQMATRLKPMGDRTVIGAEVKQVMTHRMDVLKNPVLEKLIQQAKTGSPQEKDNAINILSTAMKSADDRNWGNAKANTPERSISAEFRSAIYKTLETEIRPLKQEQFERMHGQNVTQRQQHWSNLMTTGQTRLPTQTERQNFESKTMTTLQKDPKWQVASGGTAGSIFVGDRSTGQAVIMKIDADNNAEVAPKVSNYIHSVMGQLPPSEARFETMLAKQHDLKGEVTELTKKFTEMRDNPNSTDREKYVATRHLENIGVNHIHEYGLVTLSLVDNSTDVNALPIEDRVALCKTDVFAQDLGRGAINSMLFGLADHVSLVATDGGKFTAGVTNLSNLMMDKTSGKLVFIDFTALKGGRTDGQYGRTSDEVGRAYQNVADYMVKNLTQGNIDQVLEGIVKETANAAGHSPIGALMNVVFETGLKEEGSFSNMFSNDETGALDSIDKNDRMKFAANVFRGIIAELKLMKDHPGAYTSNSAMVDNPQGLMSTVSNFAGSLTAIDQELQNFIANH